MQTVFGIAALHVSRDNQAHGSGWTYMLTFIDPYDAVEQPAWIDSRTGWLLNHAMGHSHRASWSLQKITDALQPVELSQHPVRTAGRRKVMASISLQPDKRHHLKRFIEMQFRIEPQRPPSTLSFAGKTAVVTGGYIGIGLACAREMLDHHLSHLIIAVRSVEKGEVAANALRQAHRDARIDVWALDMLSYSSVQDFARRCSTLPRLDIVVLNAGVSGSPTYNINPSTGHEETIQVNTLSTVLLGILLLPVLKKASIPGRPGRLTMVASATAFTCAFKNRDATPLIAAHDKLEGPWNIAAMSERYALSKLLVMMLMLKLSETVSCEEVVINAVEPGFTAGTGLQRHAKGTAVKAVLAILNLTAHTPEHAAWTYIDAAATKGKESHGSFLMNYRIFPFPAIMYTPEGKKVTERFWDEFLQESESAGFGGILSGMQKWCQRT